MAIEEYKNKYENPAKWFVEEVNQPYHVNRITKCIANRDYLATQGTWKREFCL